MNRSMPGLPVHHQLLEFTQTHTHRVSDAIQPSHPPAPNPSKHQSFFPMSQLFTWGGQSTGFSALASFLPKNPRVDLIQNGLVGSPCSPRDSEESDLASITSHIHSWVLFFLWLHPFILSGFISPLISSSIWAPTDLGVPLSVSYHFAFSYCSWGLKARILKWFAIPFSGEPHIVRTLH